MLHHLNNDLLEASVGDCAWQGHNRQRKSNSTVFRVPACCGEPHDAVQPKLRTLTSSNERLRGRKQFLHVHDC